MFLKDGQKRRMQGHIRTGCQPDKPMALWWPPAESHYNIYDHSAVGYVSHAHCIVLYSAGNNITTATTYNKSNPYV